MEHIYQTFMFIIFYWGISNNSYVAPYKFFYKFMKIWHQWQTRLQRARRKINRSGNSKRWIFSEHVLTPENKRTIFLALQFVIFPVQTCKFTQEARQSQSNLKISQSFSLFPWLNLSLIFTAHSRFTRMLCLQFFMRWLSREKRRAML